MKKLLAGFLTAAILTTSCITVTNASGTDVAGADQFKLISSFNRYSTEYKFIHNSNTASYNAEKENSWVPAIVEGGFGGSNAFQITLSNYKEGDAVFFKTVKALGDGSDFAGATDFWVYVDMPADIAVGSLYFGVRAELYTDADFTFRIGDNARRPGVEGNPPAGKYYIQENGGWIEKTLDGWNSIPGEDIQGYKGFIRVPASLFTHRDGKEVKFGTLLSNIGTFYVGIQPATDPNDSNKVLDYSGKKVIIDQMGFSGPTLRNAQGTVADVMGGKQLVEAGEPNPDFTKQMITAYDFENPIFVLNESLTAPADRYVRGIKKAALGTKYDITFASTDLGKSMVFKGLQQYRDGIVFTPRGDGVMSNDFLPEGKAIASNAADSGAIFYIDTTGWNGEQSFMYQVETYDYDEAGNAVIEEVEDEETGEMKPAKQSSVFGFKANSLIYLQDSHGKFDVGLEISRYNYAYLPANYKGYVAVPFSSMELIWETQDRDGLMNLQNVKEIRIYPISKDSESGQLVLDNIGFYGPAFDPAQQVRGDANGDGKITVVDALVALQISVRLYEPSPLQRVTLDVTGDGAIGLKDALKILQYSVGLVTEF